MPWSGGTFTRTNGVHTGSTLWVQDRDAGTKILATRHDTHDQDLADGINTTLEKSGSNAATGNLDIGSNRITLVADGTAKTDAATVNQIQSNAPAFQATDTGTANSYVIALSPAITAYAAGQAITFKAANASTTASTLNVNTLGTKALKKKNDQDIASGDIEASQIVAAVYDGTSFQVTSQLGSAASAGGSNTQVQYNSSGSLAGDADLTFDGTNLTVANPLYLPDGAVATPSLTNTGDLNTGLYFPAADTVGVVTGGTEQFRFGSNPIPGSRKNLLINGNFDIWQRGTSFSTGTEYTADMWKWSGTSGGGSVSRQTFTVGQTDVPNNPTYYWRVTVGTGDVNVAFFTGIEGVSHGAGVPLTVSLWAKASETTGWLDGDSGPTLVQRYGSGGTTATRVQLDGTFQSQTITTSWQKFVATATPASISGSTVAAGNYLELFLQTDGDLSSSATLDIAQVQVEYGSVATDFDAGGDVGTILNQCYRYYERLTPNTATNQAIFQSYNVTTTVASGIFNYTHKRAAPTLTFTAGATFEVRHQTTTTVCTAAALSGSSDEDRCLCNFTVSSGLTAGQGCIIRRNGTDTTYIEVSAEL
jgi:hypothetical protein